MELDDFKTAWQTLDQRLQQQQELNLRLFRDHKLQRAKSGLRPLFWGQVAQLLWGLGFILLAALLWSEPPMEAAVIAAGVTVHLYGIGCVATAAITLVQMSRIDYSSPVLEIQKQLAKVRRSYIVGGMVAGLPWWFLWVPLIMVLAGLAGANLYANAAPFVWMGVAIGAAGLLGTRWFFRWSRDISRPRLAQAIEDGMTGASLRRARAQLDELLQFERD